MVSFAYILTAFIDVLEYFTGILIFTTNRVGPFDKAIMSRIHLVLHFSQLDLAAVITIWENFLGRLRKEGQKERLIVFNEKKILQFAERQYKQEEARWNGREIRNAIATAVALAQDEAKSSGDDIVVLGEYHFEAIARSS